MPINKFLLLLAGILVALAVFFQWKISTDFKAFTMHEADYNDAMAHYREHNIYYLPANTAQWIRNRQNPTGYFVPNLDMMFEPSQLNDSSLRATRYAISTLNDLGNLDKINRRAVGEYIFSLYEPDMKRIKAPEFNHYRPGVSYSAFKTLPGEASGVRPTMDAIITLAALDLLDDPRINLENIWNFIIAHQNPDGGFWDEHYSKYGTDSSMKCTSFAARALGILQRHLNKPFPEGLTTGIQQYIQTSFDQETGGFRGQAGKPANDSYNAFRAFVAIWETTPGTAAVKRAAVHKTIDISRLFQYLQQNHYAVDIGAFTRKISAEKNKVSIKATHLIIWLLHHMNMLDQIDTHHLSQYVMSLHTPDGEYGSDIYTTYSAIGLLQKMDIPTTAMPVPDEPEKPVMIPGYVPTVFFLTALITLAIGYQSKKHELESLNHALHYQANRDSLTGIYNRYKFESILTHEMEKSIRYTRPLSLMMFDVDYFKNINDSFGHISGDKVLREITRLVSSALRDSDIVARWGGEEFILLSPETDLAGMSNLAEKLRHLLENEEFHINQKVTASFGVAEFIEEDSINSLVNRADNAMLLAKRLGKNQIQTEKQLHAAGVAVLAHAPRHVRA